MSRNQSGIGAGVAAALFLLCLPGLGCGGKDKKPGDWKVVSSGELTPTQEQMRDRAMAARDSLFTRLGGRLMRAMTTAGPAAAITVCAEEAPLIAARVSEQHDLAIGRTSFRLRNPKNTAPGWAEPLVAERVEEETILEGSETELGVLLPIRMGGLCVTCHGPEEEIPSEVMEALAKDYPEDKATGFAPGDLRGWFWIEVRPGE